jgi:hypothetical protein
MVRDHLPPIRVVPEELETMSLDQIEVKSYVGGLVKSFKRKARIARRYGGLRIT